MNVQFTKKPSLKDPILIAAWPGMGMLARISVDYVINKLNAKKFAQITSLSNDIYFKDGLGEISQFKNIFYFVKTGQKNDLIICSGEIQPQSLDELYSLGNKVLEVAEKFGVKRVYTFAALANPQDVKPHVFGVANKFELRGFLNENGVKLAKGEGRISGLNGLLIGLAKERDMEGICLLCEIRYMDIPQPRSAQILLGTLSKLVDIKFELSDLIKQAEDIEKKLEEIKEKRTIQTSKPKDPGYIS